MSGKRRFLIMIVLVVTALVMGIAATMLVRADTMQHWANIRDQYGNVVGIASEGDYVTVTGWDASGRVTVYDANTCISGTVAPVYLYGGSEYQYENPGYYTYDNGAGYYQEYDYNYLYEDWYTGTPQTEVYQPQTYSVDYGVDYVVDYDADYVDYNIDYGYQDQVYTYQPEPVQYPTGTWVDIDIQSQTISVWKDCSQVFQSYCVTGNYGTNDTPVGTHYILSKQENATLHGVDYDADVAYWMPFTESGCGVHDATWRGNFSVGAYMGNGSHGCVNTTLGTAAEIYGLVDVGTPVVVHE